MAYISELTIESFRGINDLQLKNLGKINIIVGANNSGKTSILEVLSLMRNPIDLVNAVRVSRMREFVLSFGIGRLEKLDLFINMFNRNNQKNRIAFSGQINRQDFNLCIEGTIEKRLFDIEKFIKNPRNRHAYINPTDIADGETNFFIGNIKYTEDGEQLNIPVQFSSYDDLIPSRRTKEQMIRIEYISPIDHIVKNNQLNQLVKAGLKSEIVELLKIFDSQISGLEMVGEEQRTIPYIEHSELGLMPLSTYGDGLKKALLIAASMIIAKEGILLIDEIETAIHVSALEKVFAWFVKACQKSNVQVFATTHSLEAIDAILKYVNDDSVPSDGDDPLRIITIKKQGPKTFARILSGKEALNSREEFDLELRQ